MDVDHPFSRFHGGHSAFSSRHQHPSRRPAQKQDPAVIHEFGVSLEDLLNGCVKKMKITKRVLNSDGRTYRTDDKLLTINVKPGWKAGTKITFPKEGDQVS